MGRIIIVRVLTPAGCPRLSRWRPHWRPHHCPHWRSCGVMVSPDFSDSGWQCRQDRRLRRGHVGYFVYWLQARLQAPSCPATPPGWVDHARLEEVRGSTLRGGGRLHSRRDWQCKEGRFPSKSANIVFAPRRISTKLIHHDPSLCSVRSPHLCLKVSGSALHPRGAPPSTSGAGGHTTAHPLCCGGLSR